jgi:hypothetical protein
VTKKRVGKFPKAFRQMATTTGPTPFRDGLPSDRRIRAGSTARHFIRFSDDAVVPATRAICAGGSAQSEPEHTTNRRVLIVVSHGRGSPQVTVLNLC